MDATGLYIGNGLIVLILGYLLKILTDVRAELRKMNGRLGTVEERMHGHTKLADERHRESERRIGKLEG